MNRKKLLEKRKEKRLTIKEEKRLFNNLKEEADKVFSLFIRNRDKKKLCITSKVPSCQKKIQHCCHWIPRGYYSHRRNENNCYGGCASCNAFHQEEHKIEFTSFMIKQYGQKRVDKQLKDKNSTKPSIDELLEIIKKYK